MSFKDSSWSARFAAMGDEAEKVFEEVHPYGWDRFGHNRPAIAVNKLPMKMRYTPDYRTSFKLVECQGFGKDQTVKVKLDKLLALWLWNNDMPVDLFLWNATKKRYAYVPLEELTTALHAHAQIDSFPEGTRYWALKADQLECEWHDVN